VPFTPCASATPQRDAARNSALHNIQLRPVFVITSQLS
jgi:hypothetical protein